MSEVTLSTRAYCKVVLHAARYPHCAVNGVLLARAGGSGRGVQVEDAVPLFHQCLHVSPMAEIAMTQIDASAASAGLVIAGYYAACENFKHSSVEKCPGLKIADKIAENYPNAVFIVVENRRLVQHLDNPAIKVHQNHDSVWKPKDPNHVIFQSPSVLETVSHLLQKGVHKELIDFDNHLDDLTADWSNSGLHKLLDTMDKCND